MQSIVTYLPLVIVFLLVLTVNITLYLTYKEKHVSDSLPYISDTGTIPPESCIFGQALNLLGILISMAMYAKYRQEEHIFNKHETKKKLSRNTFYVGLIAAFGISIVANFQETNLFIVHWIGAILTFGFGSIYQCMQTVLYLSLIPIIGQKKRTQLRIWLSVVSLSMFLIFFISALISYSKKKVNDNYLHWKKEDGGYEFHNISVISEWICAISTTTYVLLFYGEFKTIMFSEPKVFVEGRNTTIQHTQQSVIDVIVDA